MEDKKEETHRTEIIPRLFPWRYFLGEAFLFFLTLGLGIITAIKVIELFKFQEISLPTLSIWEFLLYFLSFTLIFFLISRFSKFKRAKGVFFKGIFILASFFGGWRFFSLWISDFSALILITILIYFWFKRPSIFIHNLLIIFALVGLGAPLGLIFLPEVIVSLLIILSIYDFIAVYKTKHMIKMAKEMILSGTILGFILPPKISDLKTHLREVRPGGKFLILGGGDVVFPMLLCVSLVPEGILNSLIVAIFALVGLFVSFWIFISQKIRRPIPALPPIALFSIIGYLFTLFL